MRTNATVAQMEEALKTINVKYEGNVGFNRFEVKGKRIFFTLRVTSSKGPGHRLGFHHGGAITQRHLVSACWHVHGDFFNALWDIDKSIWVNSGNVGTMRGPWDNWQDKNIGSMFYPMMFSEACECE